jgi:hypothetical protein
MYRYLFDVSLNGHSLGETWVDLPSLGEMRREALNALQNIAIDEIATPDGLQILTVSIRDESSVLVYSATVTVSETWGSDGNSAARKG